MNIPVNKFGIIAALQTEKSNNDTAARKYHFLIARGATKGSVASDIKKIYSVEVEKVNITKGSASLHKKHSYLDGNNKKCVVTLKENQVINFQ